MAGTGATRQCAACEREVIDLSAMPAIAAIDALIARAGQACIRYRTDADGEIEFAAAPPRGPGVIVAAVLVLSACAGWAEEPALVVPGEGEMCMSEAEEAGACERGEVPGAAEAPRRPPAEPDPPPPATDRDFTAVVEVASSSVGDSAASLAELEQMKAEAAAVTMKFAAPGDDGVRLGMLVIEEVDPSTSLFDRDSTAGPGRDVWAIAELLRMKRQLRREERVRRRADRLAAKASGRSR